MKTNLFQLKFVVLEKKNNLEASYCVTPRKEPVFYLKTTPTDMNDKCQHSRSHRGSAEGAGAPSAVCPLTLQFLKYLTFHPGRWKIHELKVTIKGSKHLYHRNHKQTLLLVLSPSVWPKIHRRECLKKCGLRECFPLLL